MAERDSLITRMIIPEKHNILGYVGRIALATTLLIGSTEFFSKFAKSNVDPLPDNYSILTFSPEGMQLALLEKYEGSPIDRAILIIDRNGERIELPINRNTTVKNIRWAGSQLLVDESFYSSQDDYGGRQDSDPVLVEG